MPAVEPLTFHCQAGVVPPFTGVAVKVTGVPVQTGLAEGAIDTPAVNAGLTIMVTALEVAGLPVAQTAVDVITTVITSLLARVVEE